jgi:cytochrome c6
MTRRVLLATAMLLALAAIAGGCGSSDNGSSDPSSATQPTQSTQSTQSSSGGAGAATGSAAAGKKVFTSNCASCHTLKDAGTNGKVGPDLDSLKPDFNTVKNQVINGGGPMPAFGKQGILNDKQINDVATYVSSVAGK